MGTRATFFIINPMDLKKRIFAACIGWDGYAGTKTSPLNSVITEEDYTKAESKIKAACDGFSNPKESGFPWVKDLFLNDYTYAFAFFNDAVHVVCYDKGFVPLSQCSSEENIPAPTKWWSGQYGKEENCEDSILILKTKA